MQSVPLTRKTSSPPGRSSRAASGIQRYGSHQIEAPYSETARSKLASGSGTSSALASTSGNSSPNSLLHRARGLELRRRDVDADRPRAAPREPGGDVRRAAAELDDVLAGDVGKRAQLRLGHVQIPQSNSRSPTPRGALSAYSAPTSSRPRGCAARARTGSRLPRLPDLLHRPRAAPSRVVVARYVVVASSGGCSSIRSSTTSPLRRKSRIHSPYGSWKVTRRRRPRSGAGRSSRTGARATTPSASSSQQIQASERRDAEREQAARPEQPRHLGHDEVRIGEGHRAVVAEDEVEARVRRTARASALAWTSGKSTPASAISSRACSSWRSELSSPTQRAPCAREQDRPLRRAAAELEHVLPGHVAEHLQLALGQLPDPPARLRAGR